MKKYLFISVLCLLFCTSCDKHEVRTATFLGLRVSEYQVLVDENKNDIKDGYYYEFHETGKVSISGSYEMDKKVGEWKHFSNEGKLLRESTFVDGKEHGLYVSYDEEGNVIKKGNYVNGKREGVWEFALINDTTMLRQAYKNGLREDIFGTWNTVKKYSNGIKTMSFHEDGTCLIVKSKGEEEKGEYSILGEDEELKLPVGTYKISSLDDKEMVIYLEKNRYDFFLGWNQIIIKANKITE